MHKLTLLFLFTIAACKGDKKPEPAPKPAEPKHDLGSATAPSPVEAPPAPVTPDAAVPAADLVEPCVKILSKAMACKNDKAFKKALGKKAGALYTIGNAEPDTLRHACTDWTAKPEDQNFPTTGGLDWTKPTVADVATASAGDCVTFVSKLVEAGGLPTETGGND